MNRSIDIKYVTYNRRPDAHRENPFSVYEAQKAVKYHESFPEYTKTPLVELRNLAEHFGVKNIYVKDESYRFGLNAFKVLGGSYAAAFGFLMELLRTEPLSDLREKMGLYGR